MFQLFAIITNVIRSFTWLFSWVGAVLLIILLWVSYSMYVAPFQGEQFNRQRWYEALSYKTDYERIEKQLMCTRGKMVHDLLLNHLVRGVNKKQVIAALGDAVESPYKDYERCLLYPLGQCSVDTQDYLVACFSDDGMLIRAGIGSRTD